MTLKIKRKLKDFITVLLVFLYLIVISRLDGDITNASKFILELFLANFVSLIAYIIFAE